MSINQRIGKLIVELRHRRGMSQESLALEAEMDRRYLSDIENGRRNPSIAIISKIALIFGYSVTDFMMVADRPFDSLDELKEHLVELGCDETVVLESPDFINAVIGISHDGKVVYSRRIMIRQLMIEDNITDIEAEEFIEYNTIRALPYMGDFAPIIID